MFVSNHLTFFFFKRKETLGSFYLMFNNIGNGLVQTSLCLFWFQLRLGKAVSASVTQGSGWDMSPLHVSPRLNLKSLFTSCSLRNLCFHRRDSLFSSFVIILTGRARK